MDELNAQQAKPNSAARRKRSVLPMIVMPLVFVLALGSGILIYSKSQNPMRDLKTTDLESVTISAPGSDDSEKGFPISSQQWTQTIENFHSSLVNWSPAKWKRTAVIHFKKKDGTEISVPVYATNSAVGCFDVNGTYFNGGNQAFIDRLLSDGQKRAASAANN